MMRRHSTSPLPRRLRTTLAGLAFFCVCEITAGLAYATANGDSPTEQLGVATTSVVEAIFAPGPPCDPLSDRDDTFWYVSTRQLGCPECLSGNPPQLCFKQYDGQKWQTSDLCRFQEVESDGSTLTVIYAHGNRASHVEALAHGRALYRALARKATAQQRIRFVVWSWPSSQIPGPIKDVRTKARRTNNEGYYLGWFLAQFRPQAKVTLIGYSFGARVVSGGLHVRGGGSLAGCQLIDTPQNKLPARAVLLAAAAPDYWLYPSKPHGLALSQTERMLLLYNPCDPVLKRYHVVETRCHPAALGYTGVANRKALGSDGDKLEQINVGCIAGKTHDEQRYFASRYLMNRIVDFALWRSDGE